MAINRIKKSSPYYKGHININEFPIPLLRNMLPEPDTN